jgi:HTH-type transcriptional regulator, cell division transcriptional repressor
MWQGEEVEPVAFRQEDLDSEAIGRRIRFEREVQQGWTVEDLARVSLIAPSTIRNYEHGRTIPRGHQLRRLAEVFRRTPKWLVTGEDDPE